MNTDRKTAAIAGSSGLVGSALFRNLREKGWRVIRFVRGREARTPDEIQWSPPDGIAEPERLEGIDALINLAGESVGGLWTEKRKKRIYASRIGSTDLLVREIKKLSRPPKTFVSASAIGFYGPARDSLLTEDSSPGGEFLAKVCRDWERSASELKNTDVRVVTVRISLVLDADAPAVQRMMTPFKLGLGGKLGDGKQWMSWVTLTDLIRALVFIIESEHISGPVNLSAPEPVTNEVFTEVLSRGLKRPALFRVPKFLLRALLREQADEMLLASQRVIPQKLLDNGFQFTHNTIEKAMTHLLSRDGVS